MRGKAIIVTILLAGLALILAGQAFALPSDTGGHWAEEQIGDWIERGLASGYPDGTFKPDDSINRAEFITLANKSFGFTGSAGVGFSDVQPGVWFYEEVARAKAAGYISGYEDETLRPFGEISRQETAAVIVRLLGLGCLSGSGVLSGFADVESVSAWSKPFVSTVVNYKLMGGYPDQTFKPLNPVTRAEAVVCLERALAYKRTHKTGG